jgi:hypothetical protein
MSNKEFRLMKYGIALLYHLLKLAVKKRKIHKNVNQTLLFIFFLAHLSVLRGQNL